MEHNKTAIVQPTVVHMEMSTKMLRKRSVEIKMVLARRRL